MGVEPGHPLLKSMLDYYKDRSFIKEDGSKDTLVIPKIIYQFIKKDYIYNQISIKSKFSFDSNVINVFTSDYFSPKNYNTKEIITTINTYSIHHFDGAWLRPTKDEGLLAYWRVRLAL